MVRLVNNQYFLHIGGVTVATSGVITVSRTKYLRAFREKRDKKKNTLINSEGHTYGNMAVGKKVFLTIEILRADIVLDDGNLANTISNIFGSTCRLQI